MPSGWLPAESLWDLPSLVALIDSARTRVRVQLLSYGTARVEKGYMAKAVVPAARDALKNAGVSLDDVKVIKTHNPFAVNDVVLSKELGIPAESFNHYGSPIVYGHPQGPTGMRVMVELIEEIAAKGGGYGLFSGCAAGDTAMAAVVKVG